MKKLFLLFALSIPAVFTFGQIVTTFHNVPSQKVDDCLTLDNAGNLYGSNYNGTNVYKITPGGTASVFATGFNTPNGLAFDSQQNLYVCDMQGGRIYKLSNAGAFLDTIVVPNPSNIIKTMNSDTMIFTQYQSHKLNKLAPDGTIVPMLTGSPLVGPVGLAFDSLGTLFIGNFDNRKIYRLNADTLEYVATVPGPAGGWLGFITYTRGSLWGTSFSGQKIYQIYPYAVDSVTLFAGSTAGNVDGPVSTAKFNGPNGIIPSATGDSLYISDYTSGRIRIIDFFGTVDVEDGMGADFHIFPNPTHGAIHIESDKKIQKAEVFNLDGKLLFSANTKDLSLDALPAGGYILRLESAGQRYASRIVKL